MTRNHGRAHVKGARRWLSGADADADYEIRVLTGAHAGARLRLSEGRYTLGDDLRADVFLSDLGQDAAPLRLWRGRAAFGETGAPMAATPCYLSLGSVQLLVCRRRGAPDLSPATSAHCPTDRRNARAIRPRAVSRAP